METLEKLVKNFANKIRYYHRQKSKLTTLKNLLAKQFIIQKRTNQTMQYLSNLFKRNSLYIYKENISGLKSPIELDLTDLREDLYQKVFVIYKENEKKNENEISIDTTKIVPAESAGIAPIIKSKLNFQLFDHQLNAIKSLENYFNGTSRLRLSSSN